VRQDHRDRQRDYRERLRSSRVTDQSSIIDCGSGSISAPLLKAAVEEVNVQSKLRWPARLGWIVCRICGRVGKFVAALIRRE
jgi:hypothetical protein